MLSEGFFDELDILVLVLGRLMLVSVLFPGLPPTEAEGIHGVTMLSLIVREDLNDLLPLSDWGGHKHESIQEVVEVEIFLSPQLESEKVYLIMRLTLDTASLTPSVARRGHHDLEVMLDPLLVYLVAGPLAELAEALH